VSYLGQRMERFRLFNTVAEEYEIVAVKLNLI
jgi:hypothetical protein